MRCQWLLLCVRLRHRMHTRSPHATHHHIPCNLDTSIRDEHSAQADAEHSGGEGRKGGGRPLHRSLVAASIIDTSLRDRPAATSRRSRGEDRSGGGRPLPSLAPCTHCSSVHLRLPRLTSAAMAEHYVRNKLLLTEMLCRPFILLHLTYTIITTTCRFFLPTPTPQPTSSSSPSPPPPSRSTTTTPSSPTPSTHSSSRSTPSPSRTPPPGSGPVPPTTAPSSRNPTPSPLAPPPSPAPCG